ncbi:MAG: hypothetical protein ACK5IJ_00090 [Mangrovibacterium sp.]
MKREIITISEDGVITIPSATTAPILMRDFEIAELFGVYSPTIKAAIKAVLKSGAVAPDYTHGGVVIGKSLLPDYFGLDMITAIAFRIHSPEAQVFRELILSRLSAVSKPISRPVFIQINSDKDKLVNQLIN